MSSSILFPTNEYATASKSSQQIQKLMLPPFTSFDQSLSYIVSKGLNSQMPFVNQFFMKLYRHMHQSNNITLSFVCHKTLTQEPQNQILIAESLKIVLIQQKQLKNQDLEKIFETALDCLNNLHSSANQSMRTILEIVIEKHRNNNKLIKRLQQAIIDLGKPTQPIISKVTSGRLISILAKYIGRTIKGEMIDILKRILGDSEVQARKIWVSQIFPRLLQNLQLQFIELHLQQKIYQSVWDQNEEVGALALEAILKNVSLFSLEEQSTRIVKLFIDSLTSKKERIVYLTTELIGQTYKKLQKIILKSQTNCVRFWRSLIEISQSANERVLNNLAFNLPGILILSAPFFRVDALCDVYIELFYQPISNKMLLASYFHQISKLFPSKTGNLKQLIYWMLDELFEQDEPFEEAIRIVSKLIQHLEKFKHLFFNQVKPQEDNSQGQYFQSIFNEYILKYLNLLFEKKNSNWLEILYSSIKNCSEHFPYEFIEQSLLPKLYACLRGKTSSLEMVVQVVVILVSRDSNSSLINGYISKINAQLSKSNKSYERQIALLFFYYSTHYFSIQLFQQYHLGQKYLYFNNDKNFRVRTIFIKNLSRLLYFFTRQQKIQNAIILSRLCKDPDPQIQIIISSIDLVQNENVKKQIVEYSQILKQRQKQKMSRQAFKKAQNQLRRNSKQLKKEDVLKKRIQTTKSKVKMLIKEIPKKKIAPTLVKSISNINFRKN